MEKLVEKSTRQYRAIQEKLAEMATLLQAGKMAALVRVQQQWGMLNAEAQETDRLIGLSAKAGHPTEACLAAMQDRRQIMLQVQQQCEKLKRQARDLQVLTGEELGRLKQGRKALGGYRSSNQGAGHSDLGRC